MIESLRDALGYGVWVGLLVLIIGGFYFWFGIAKKSNEPKLWKWAAIIAWAFTILIILAQFFGT